MQTLNDFLEVEVEDDTEELVSATDEFLTVRMTMETLQRMSFFCRHNPTDIPV